MFFFCSIVVVEISRLKRGYCCADAQGTLSPLFSAEQKKLQRMDLEESNADIEYDAYAV